MAQYVFTMNRVGKIVPPKRQILKNISLSFFPGAKIGVLGLNGSGKSTLLKIMAGIDNDFEGEATPMPGLKIGYLPQEPRARPGADRARGGRGRHRRRAGGEEAPRRGLRRVRRARRRLRQARRRAGRARGASSPPPAARTPSMQLEIAADALRLPPWDAVIGKLSGGEKRRVALCRMLLSQARHAAARRADQPPRRRKRRLARAVPAALPRHRRGHHPRPLLPRQRRRVDPRTRPRLAAFRTRATTAIWLEQKEQRLEQEQKTEDARTKAMKKELEWVRQNPKGRQAKSKARLARFEELSRRRIPEAQRDQRDLHSGGRAPRATR